MENNEGKLPYGLISIKVKNFRGIKNADLEGIPRNTSWIFLTGRNGYGKTCFLQAILTALLGNHDKNNLLENSKFYLEIKGYTPEIEFVQPVEGPGPVWGTIVFPVLAYGASRLNPQPDLSSNEEDKRSSISYNLFNPDGILLNIERELKNWFYRSQSKEIKPGTANLFSQRYNSVLNILLELLPNLDKITVNVENDKVEYFEKDDEGNMIEEPRSFKELASGNQSIIAMIGDMIIRLFRIQTNVSSASELSGLVIIDEFDLHLHPDWQYELPGLLSKVFPKIQFIASTHSPIPLLGAPEGSIFTTVDRTEGKGITIKKLDVDVRNLTPNLILTSEIFGFHNIIAKTNLDQDQVRTEDTMAEKEFRDELKKRLVKFAEEEGEYPKNLFKK